MAFDDADRVGVWYVAVVVEPAGDDLPPRVRFRVSATVDVAGRAGGGTHCELADREAVLASLQVWLDRVTRR